MHASFVTTILYTQILVSTPGQPAEVSWTDPEVAQGFASNAHAVAFGVPDHDGECLVEVDTDHQAPFTVSPDALWAVAAPYTAREIVEVGTVMLERPFPILPGRYQVYFEARPGDPGHAYRLGVVFVREASPHYAILKQGNLTIDRVLSPAVPHG